jgi:hypothetical protein
MRTLLQASALALALLGSASFAVAQTTPGGADQQEKLNLSQSQEGQVTRGLNREQAQSAAGYSGQIGSKPPGSLSAKPMPDDVTAQVPETKGYLFLKLPDRILLIDPDTGMVAEIVGGPATTGSRPAGETSPAGTDSRSR